MGHANPSITLRINSHWVLGTRRITTSILDTETANKQQMLEKNGGEEKEEKSVSYSIGGAEGDRTPDLLTASLPRAF